MKIDSHQHFWKYHPVKDAWITDEMKTIQRDFLPVDIFSLLQQQNIDGCVAIQSAQSEAETAFLLQLAEENNFIKGVVGWIDLCAKNVEERLAYFSQYKKLKGLRHIVQSELQDDFLVRDDFCNGIKKLSTYDLTYDILIYPKHLKYAKEFVMRFPNQRFIIDHLAKPSSKNNDLLKWEKDIKALAAYPNVHCKVSGIHTENLKPDELVKCLETVINAFGTNRLLFGSDWPVCLLAASYNETYSFIQSYFSKFSTEEKDKFFGKNAIEFYHL